MSSEIDSELGRARILYPHPIAVACGRVLRARNLANRLDAILRAGEALTRYTAALALASLAAQNGERFVAPSALQAFSDNLSWGHFLDVVQQVTAAGFNHPLAEPLTAAFQSGRKGIAPAGDPLTQLLSLRNELGHDLQAIGEAKAQVVFLNQKPDHLLVNALRAESRLLGLPLFLIEDQPYTHRRYMARRLLLMGESDNPVPEDVEFASGLAELNVLYVGLKSGALKLWPWLTWDLAEQRVTYAVFVVHAIQKQIKYKSMFSDNVERNAEWVQNVTDRLTGLVIPLEQVSLADGRNFLDEWVTRRRAIEQSLRDQGGLVPWSELDEQTLQWYAGRLPQHGHRDADPHTIIQSALLDGRDLLRAEEIKQLILLFGSERAIRRLLQRELLDCRARTASEVRWSDRILTYQNVLECLRTAVQFFGKHIGIDGATLDGLSATVGSADYIAMREALVNLFIHQDYNDPSAPAQIELTPDRAVFFNPGKSLVNLEALVDGGRTQSRNPLLSRALRLIGFAELYHLPNQEP